MTCGEYFVEPYQISFTGLGARWVVRQYHGACACGAEEMINTPATFETLEDAVLFAHIKNRRTPKAANGELIEPGTPAGGNS